MRRGNGRGNVNVGAGPGSPCEGVVGSGLRRPVGAPVRIPRAAGWIPCAAGWIVPAVALIIGGCHRPQGALFPAVASAPVWPMPPEAPRIRYVGQLRSSEDLHAGKTGWQVFREALTPAKERPVRFVTPHAVAVGPGDRLYVADTGAGCVHIVDLANRTHVRIVDAGDRRLVNPVGVAVGSHSLFVTDAALGALFEFSLDGVFLRRVDVDVERPGGVAYAPASGRLYVVDTARHRCVCLSESGQTLFSFGQRGLGPGEFNYPTSVATHPLLGVLVSDTLNFRVQRFDPDGVFVSSIGRKGDGAGDFSLPKGVAADREGHIYVVDAQFENVQIFDATGRLLLAFGQEGSGPGELSIPAGLAIDARNRIYVADARNGRIEVFQFLPQASP